MKVIRVDINNVRMNKYAAEAFGTMMLVLVVGLSLTGGFPISTPVLAALTLGLFVYSIGHVSGAHLNPAVTVGLWAIGKVGNRDTGIYVLSQLVGTVVAMFVLQSTDTTVAAMESVTDIGTGFAEFFGAAVFTFGIAAVVFGKVPGSMSGIVVGGSLLLGITVAALLGSNGVLNPAVALAINSFNLMYVLGPIVGAVLGMQFYQWLCVTQK